MFVDFIALHGKGLHTGERCSIAIRRRAGPLTLLIQGHEAALDELQVTRADQGVRVRVRSTPHEVDLVEHLLAALAGLSVRSGLVITVDGPEVPLLDGGALELARAVLALRLPRERPRLVVRRAGTVTVGEARYAFEPKDDVEVAAKVDFARGGIGTQEASFHGDPERFVSEIAPARTFGFVQDRDELFARGRARGVDPASVLVLDEQGNVAPPGAPPTAGEFARHKLLDLLGDLYLFGGPPVGRVAAERPGHAATHAALLEATTRGLIARC